MTDRERRLRNYVDQLVLERADLQKTVRWLQDQTAALEARLARQAVKDTFRDMEGM